MSDNHRSRDTQQPLALGSLRNWLRLLWTSGGVDRAFLRRAMFVSAVSSATAPLRVWQRLLYPQGSKTDGLDAAPIFILGHWRSGTTLLHHLLCKDPALGYVSTFQSIAPEWFLVAGGAMRRWVARRVPRRRAMDNIPLGLDDPQEEEFAVAQMSPFSFYHQWSFPRNARRYFEKYVLFDGVPESVVAAWRRTYLSVLRTAARRSGGKRLALKNPVNTARIRHLLDLFPDARFIHIVRNPYTVFLSTRHFFESLLTNTRLQETSREEIEANVLWFYERLMRRFLAERDLIPPENLVEIRFEQFEADPLGELRGAYSQLRLPGFDATEDAFRGHLASLNGYRKNRYTLDDHAIRNVERHWGFALAHWGYGLPAEDGDLSIAAAREP
jgi:omega-hydroxy-beta-dihydromenaquinone-9 sulfotransferase